MIKAENLSKQFSQSVKQDNKQNKTKKVDFWAVDHINFQVEKGDIFGILGPNGAGKTTLMRMLGGILTPTTGSICVAGINYNENKNGAKNKLGYLSGNTKLYGRLTPRELLHTFGELYTLSETLIQTRTKEIFDILDINNFADARIEQLSTGQTQRVSIARCLVHSPELYIFDEPTLGLDVMSSQTIIEFMQKEQKNQKTVLYSTHYMEEAETICNKIMMFHRGKIVAIGSPAQIKEKTNTTNLRDAFISFVQKEETAHA